MSAGRVFLRLSLCFFLAVFIRSGHSAPACSFSFPSTADSSQCDGYDLFTIASSGGANISSTFNYVLTICENLPSASIPSVCRSKPPAPAYQYNTTSCVAIGNLSAPFYVSIYHKVFTTASTSFSCCGSTQWTPVTAELALGLATTMEVCGSSYHNSLIFAHMCLYIQRECTMTTGPELLSLTSTATPRPVWEHHSMFSSIHLTPTKVSNSCVSLTGIFLHCVCV